MGFGAVLLTGCGGRDELTAPPPPPPAIQTSVTATAAAALGTNTQFAFPDAQMHPDELSGQQARAIAEAWARTHGPMIRQSLEEEHGAAIDFGALRACGRAFYAESPFEPLDPSVHPSVQNHFGSKWLIGLCNRYERLAVSVAVAVSATRLRIEDGSLRVSNSPGSEIFAMGIPSDWDSPVGMSPERAVAHAAASGRLVTAVPRLIGASPSEAYAQGALWLVSLNGEARLRNVRSGRERRTATVYIGVGNRVGTARATSGAQANDPLDVQPDVVPVSYSDPTAPSSASGPRNPPPTVTVTARRRSDIPIRFERAAIEGGD
jgi:hypothetical protein